jgi:hypothetical protein
VRISGESRDEVKRSMTDRVDIPIALPLYGTECDEFQTIFDNECQGHPNIDSEPHRLVLIRLKWYLSITAQIGELEYTIIPVLFCNPIYNMWPASYQSSHRSTQSGEAPTARASSFKASISACTKGIPLASRSTWFSCSISPGK